MKVICCPESKVTGPDGAIETLGEAFTVTEGGDDWAEVEFEVSLTVTVIRGEPAEPGV